MPWHQDLTISVKEQVEIDGYGPWTVKAGVVNVQPPLSILERMLAIRFHLDDCDERNGVLKGSPSDASIGTAECRPDRVCPGRKSRRQLFSEEWRSCFDETTASTRIFPSSRAKPSAGDSHRFRVSSPGGRPVVVQ